MVERDVVLAKAATIERCLTRIAEVRARAKAGLTPMDVEDIVVLNLTRAVQAAGDLAAHVVVSEGLGLVDSLGASFTVLEKNGIVSAALAAKLRAAAGFRNVAVHAYDTVDSKVVDAIATQHVHDLRLFASQIVARYAP